MASAWLHGTKYRIRVPRSDRRLVAVSTGTGDRRTAHAIERMVEQLASRAEFPVLDAIADGKRRLLQTYAEYRDDARLTDTKQAIDDVDIEPMVSVWHRETAQRNADTANKYLAQVRRLIPEGAPFPASRFRRRVLSEHIAGLTDLQSAADVKPPVSPSTRNRHRAALRQFGRWLVEREVIEHNPVADVRASRENAPRSTIYAPADVRRLVDALTGSDRVLAAVLASTGMEMQAAKRLRRRDVDLERRELHAHGSKTAWRNRTVAVTEAWAWPIIAAHAKPLLPNALLFPDLDHTRALDAHHAACSALRLAPSTLHDHRHHYAVALRRRGVSDVVIAKQLGHGSTMLVATRYGRYQPDAAEVTRAAGNGARPAQKRGARRAK